MRKAFEYLVSGCIVYFVVAACSASSGTNNNGGADNSSSDTDNGDVANNGGVTGHGGVADTGGVANNGGSTIGNTSGASGEHNTNGGNSNAGGTTPSGGNSGSGGMMDQMMNPVPDALAESGTRLKAKWITTADGAKQWNNSWHDSMRNEDCTFTNTSSGLRCLPAAASIGSLFYSDAGCTSSLAYIVKGCAASTKYAVASTATCPVAVGHIYSVGVAHTGTFYTESAGNCVEANPALATSYDFYALGAEVPLTDFAAGTETVDP